MLRIFAIPPPSQSGGLATALQSASHETSATFLHTLLRGCEDIGGGGVDLPRHPEHQQHRQEFLMLVTTGTLMSGKRDFFTASSG
jgi:hypothetical protein